MGYRLEVFSPTTPAQWQNELQVLLDGWEADGWNVLSLAVGDVLPSGPANDPSGLALSSPHTILLMYRDEGV